MAFNFNWSPLTADADFYSRAQDLLTTALNKSPKPPIIVDDILVNELNLGSVPPELEILEIGDLAEDRFRGIFKMCYSGDAFLTLKTRVQANPLNTYLFSKPSFTSPDPLAASSGLTIPLQITLSEIKLSAFIILVFSRQKGLTLVFRNDPLESLKVSSTFDSIPFVRDYLQKEIEAQLRVLFMEELPAIIHRLSLRLWCPEYRAKEDQELEKAAEKEQEEIAIDPLATPPQDAVDARGNVLDASEISSLSLDGGSETHSLFSQKNLLRLAALTDSHRTLSLFTPSIRDTVFRAWAQPSEHSNGAGTSTPSTPSLTRSHSSQGSHGTVYTFDDPSLSSRPSLVSLQSATTGLSLGAGRHSRAHHNQKKKRRVVNLRKRSSSDDGASESGESTTTTTTESTAAASEEHAVPRIPEEPEEDPITPPRSPISRVRFDQRGDETLRPGNLPRRTVLPTVQGQTTPTEVTREVAREQTLENVRAKTEKTREKEAEFSRQHRPSYEPLSFSPEKGRESRSRGESTHSAVPFTYAPQMDTPSGGIVEQAWMLKMAGEIARRVNEGKTEGFWEAEGEAPPAYAVAAQH